MEFEQQKPITDEYRKNWDRIFGYGKSFVLCADGTYAVSMNAMHIESYSNGCPILSEGPQKDDL